MRYKYLGFFMAFAFLLWVIRAVDAQEAGVAVSDAVTGQSNVPLIGVSIRIKDASSGTVTSTSGSYKLTVPKMGDTLVFSYLGYETQHIGVKSTHLNVTLYPGKGKQLNEVVVIGYGAVNK